jgi:hypothetical protein
MRVRQHPPAHTQDHRPVPLYEHLESGLVVVLVEVFQQFSVVEVACFSEEVDAA